MSHFFSSNLRTLRKSKKLSQEAFAQKIGTNRPKIGSYEEARAEPSLETLQNISHFFKVTIDDLLEKDLSLSSLEKSKDFSANDLRILPIVVDSQQKERISLVPIQAAAGYLTGYSDPEFIEELPHFNLPLPEFSQGSYRAFQIKGDSMLPLQPGTFLIAEYLENWNWIQSHSCYIVVSQNDGLVYKRVVNKFPENNCLELHSDNPAYEPYEVHGSELLELWKVKAYLSFDLPRTKEAGFQMDSLSKLVFKLQSEVEALKGKN